MGHRNKSSDRSRAANMHPVSHRFSPCSRHKLGNQGSRNADARPLRPPTAANAKITPFFTSSSLQHDHRGETCKWVWHATRHNLCPPLKTPQRRRTLPRGGEESGLSELRGLCFARTSICGAIQEILCAQLALKLLCDWIYGALTHINRPLP